MGYRIVDPGNKNGIYEKDNGTTYSVNTLKSSTIERGSPAGYPSYEFA
jgi:hypothetical protein